MRRYLFCSLILLLCLISIARAEVFTSADGYRFEVNLKLPKTSIMLGEPIYFDFEIKNLSAVDLGAVFGGDYRNQYGRPDSFEVKIFDAKGTIIPKPKTMTMGGLIGARKIIVGQNYDFRLYLPHWGTIKRLGNYKIQVEKDLGIGKYDKKDHQILLSSKKYVPVKLSAEINVIPADFQKMGAIIDEIGKKLVAQDDTAERLVPFILDRRIINYLVEAIEKNHWLMRHLAKFNNERAFQAILNKIKDEKDEIRRNVSISLSLSVHPKAAGYLLQMRTDKNAAIRLDVVHYLGKVKTKDSTRMLKEMINDKDKWVQEESKRYLTERGEKL